MKDEGQHAITSGWARLVIHGNQELEAVRSDSPTVSKQSLRIQLTLAVQSNWKMH